MVEEWPLHPYFLSSFFIWQWYCLPVKSRCNGDRNRSWRTSGRDQCVRVSQSLRDHLHQQGSYAVSWKHDPTDRRGKSGDHKMGVPVVFDDTDKDASAVIGAKQRK